MRVHVHAHVTARDYFAQPVLAGLPTHVLQAFVHQPINLLLSAHELYQSS